ncbi:ribokinase [Planctomycetota bacterium]
MGTVTVIGSSNIDLVIQNRSLPRIGETVTNGDFFRAFGGKGANQAVAAARAGSQVHFIGSVGDDSFGKQMIENLKQDGITVDGVSVCSGNASGVALIMIDEKGENIISVAPGANRLLSPDSVCEHRHLIEESDAVLIQLEIPLDTVYAGIEVASEAKIPVILNPAPVPPEPIDSSCLSLISYLLPNRGELGMITGLNIGSREMIENAVNELMNKGVGSVIVTMGKEGVYYKAEENSGSINAVEVDSLDTVGAGDCFAGCLATALANAKSLEEAISFGNAGAALSVTRRGAQPSMPYLNEIENILSSYLNKKES